MTKVINTGCKGSGKSLVCPNPECGRKTIYYRIDGTLRCTACGYDSREKV